MSITEQLAIIAQQAHDEVVLAALCLSLAALIVILGAAFWQYIRRWVSLSKIEGTLLAAFVIGFIQYGATKSKITFDGGIKQNSQQPSAVTNSTVSIRWMRDTSGGVYVPETATVYIDYRLSTNTNGEWQALGSTTVGQWHYATIFANATNYDYNVWAYYIPPAPVHTNGVWVYKTLKDRADKYPIPLRARIEVNGKAIATPKEKRKDESK